MEYQLDQAVAILRRTPATLTALLQGLPEEWTKSAPGPDTWSAYDVLGHLLHSEEADWIVRAPGNQTAIHRPTWQRDSIRIYYLARIRGPNSLARF